MHTVEISEAQRTIAILVIFLAFTVPPSRAEGPSRVAIEAFDRYIAVAEAQAQDQPTASKNFLYIDALPERQRVQSYALLRSGQPLIRRSPQCESRCPATPGALLHDWTGIVFVPGFTLADTLAALQDYNRDADYYRPQVTAAKLLAKSGNHFRVFLRLQQTHVITVVLDTEYEIQYTTIDDSHATSQSHSTRISEVQDPGSRQERSIAHGADHGFLWRLNSYWHFYQADGGVYIQCNAISLTRDVPTGLGWLVAPYIQNISQESLHFTLAATRDALSHKFRNAPANNPEKGEPQ